MLLKHTQILILGIYQICLIKALITVAEAVNIPAKDLYYALTFAYSSKYLELKLQMITEIQTEDHNCTEDKFARDAHETNR